MATLKKAIEYSKQNPGSPFAIELQRRISSGQLDQEAIQEGIDFSSVSPSFSSARQRRSQVNDLGSDIKETFSGLGDIAQETKSQIQETQQKFREGEVGGLRGTTRIAGSLARGVTGGLFETLKGGIKQFLPQAGEDVVQKAAEGAVEKISQEPIVQKTVETVSDLQESNPEVFQDVVDVLSIAEVATAPIQVGFGGRAASQAGRLVREGVEEAGSRLRSISNIKKFQAVTPQKQIDDFASSLTNNAFTTTKTNARNYNNLLDRNIDPAQILAKRGLEPDINDGKLDFSSVVQKLEQEADEYNDVISRAINVLPDNSVPRASIEAKMDEFIDDSLDIRQTGKAAEFKEKGRAELDRLLGDRQEITVKELQDFKIGQTKLSKQFKRDLQTSEADFHSAVADGFRRTIEDAIPNVQIKQLNEQLGSLLETMKFLERVDRTAVKGGRLGTGTGRVLGGIIGTGAGGPVGGVAGTIVGGSLAQQLQKNAIVSPIKRFYIRQIEKGFKNPTLQKAVNYLDAVEAGRTPEVPQEVLQQLKADEEALTRFLNIESE